MSSTIRGLKLALNQSGRYKFKNSEYTVDHLIIGGGVVGLAIARRLAQAFPDKSTFLVERHSRAGEETSSRNSEVIHSGLYYPPTSLKTALCLRGRHHLYNHCTSNAIPHRKTGKLVVAHHTNQMPYLEGLLAKSKQLSWPSPFSTTSANDEHDLAAPVLPLSLISGDEAREMEPNLSKDIVAALWCPETGIVDSHELMESLEKDISNSTDNAERVYATRVVRIDRSSPSSYANSGNEPGWVVQTKTGGSETDTLLAKTVINAAGLSAPLVINAILPDKEQHIPMYFARGSYASYSGPGVAGISRLIYPCPETGAGAGPGKQHAFQSLGTHLTLDIQGKVRFGPDIDWLDPPEQAASEEEEESADFWNRYLVPDSSKMPEIHKAVRTYLANVQLDGFAPDYAGIRPKLVGPGGGFQDFVIRTDFVDQDDNKSPKMVSLLGIESPGLTASLALAEYVEERVRS